jgi:hypothetical protein
MLAGGQGFEPRLMDPESIVLPLDDPPFFASVAPYSKKRFVDKILSIKSDFNFSEIKVIWKKSYFLAK